MTDSTLRGRFVRPILSVAVCARDDRHRLSLCLEGIAQQAWHEIEVVVVNDGGPPLDEVLEPFAIRFALRSDRLDPPSDAYRLAAARNRALRLARDNRVLFLDQDCVAGPGVLAAMVGRIRNDSAGRRMVLRSARLLRVRSARWSSVGLVIP